MLELCAFVACACVAASENQILVVPFVESVFY